MIEKKHEAARARVDATDGALHCGWDDGLDDAMQELVWHAREDLADALDEIERLRALTTITDNMVERAADAAYENLATQDPRWNEVHGDTEFATIDGSFHFLETIRAALEAGLNTKETPDA